MPFIFKFTLLALSLNFFSCGIQTPKDKNPTEYYANNQAVSSGKPQAEPDRDGKAISIDIN